MSFLTDQSEELTTYGYQARTSLALNKNVLQRALRETYQPTVERLKTGTLVRRTGVYQTGVCSAQRQRPQMNANILSKECGCLKGMCAWLQAMDGTEEKHQRGKEWTYRDRDKGRVT